MISEVVVYFWLLAELVAYCFWPIVAIIVMVLIWKIWRRIKKVTARW